MFGSGSSSKNRRGGRCGADSAATCRWMGEAQSGQLVPRSETSRPHPGHGINTIEYSPAVAYRLASPPASSPPSITNACPVMYSASSEARNVNRAATSSGRPCLPSGIFSSTA